MVQGTCERIDGGDIAPLQTSVEGPGRRMPLNPSGAGSEHEQNEQVTERESGSGEHAEKALGQKLPRIGCRCRLASLVDPAPDLPSEPGTEFGVGLPGLENFRELLVLAGGAGWVHACRFRSDGVARRACHLEVFVLRRPGLP